MIQQIMDKRVHFHSVSSIYFRPFSCNEEIRSSIKKNKLINLFVRSETKRKSQFMIN